MEGLSKLAPWFGASVSVQGDQFCAGGLAMAYTPLMVRARLGWNDEAVSGRPGQRVRALQPPGPHVPSTTRCGPLQAYANTGLYAPADADAGVQVSLRASARRAWAAAAALRMWAADVWPYLSTLFSLPPPHHTPPR